MNEQEERIQVKVKRLIMRTHHISVHGDFLNMNDAVDLIHEAYRSEIERAGLTDGEIDEGLCPYMDEGLCPYEEIANKGHSAIAQAHILALFGKEV